jgi:hypothetical protein
MNTLLIDLVTQLRQRLDDEGGDAGGVDDDLPYWTDDDTGLLWSNRELTRYLTAAQNELATRIPIKDSAVEHAEVTRIAVAPNVADYALDPRILAVDWVERASVSTALSKLSDATQLRNEHYDGDDSYADPDELTYYRTDVTRHVLTVYATPTAVDELRLTVRRLPMEAFDWADRESQRAEYPPQYDVALLDWACHQALLKRDSQTMDKELSGYFQGQFSDRVGPRVQFNLSEIRHDVAGARLRTRAYY